MSSSFFLSHDTTLRKYCAVKDTSILYAHAVVHSTMRSIAQDSIEEMHLKYTVDTVYSNMICTRYLLYVVKMF